MKKQSNNNSRNLGHAAAILFYMVLGYFFFVASTNMNYVWKWNSVPKYFAYEEVIDIEAPIDGVFILENGKFYIEGEEKIELVTLDDSFKLDYTVGEEVYEDDLLASKTEMRAGPIINGLFVTIKVSFFAIIMAFFIGISLALMKLSSSQFLKDVATVYITIIRGTPLLVQIFLFYFIVANIFELSTMVAGIMALGIFFGAYTAEVLRGAIQSIDKGQMEASSSLGISKFQAMRHIILPQAFKRALPTLVGEVIALVKDSSLISVISITDLTKVGKEIVANTFSPFETWIVIALLYLCMTSTISYIGHRIEKRMALKGGIS